MKKIRFSLLKFGLLVLLATPSVSGQQATLVSVNRSGSSRGSSQAYRPEISANGRFVVFESTSRNLVEFDIANPPYQNLFVRDLVAGTTRLVTINSAGTGGGNGRSVRSSISASGRFIAFTSEASNLVTNDTNGHLSDTFVRDQVTGTTRLVSVNSAGTGSGNGVSLWATISADGRFVVFQSNAGDLAADALGGTIFMRDMVAGKTILVSVNHTGTGNGNGFSGRAWISPNGRYVTFSSQASDLVTNDTNGSVEDVFVRDLVAGTTKLVSVNSTGTGSGNDASLTNYRSTVSANGRFVAFYSVASDLVPYDYNGKGDVFVRDTVAGTTELVSVNYTGTGGGNNHTGSDYGISPDGRFIIMNTWATDLVENDFNGTYTDVFVRDRVAGRTTPLGINIAGTGTGSPYGSTDAVMSANGRFVAFTSYAADLTNNDKTTNGDVYVRDLIAGTTTLASVNIAGTGSANKTSYIPAISSDGRMVAFQSFATNLAPNDPNLNLDVFAISIAGGSLQFSDSQYHVDEGGGSITVKVKRTGSSKGAVSVDLITRNGTALAGRDYAATSATLTFANGETVKTITIPINDDALDEADETINLFLSNPTGNALLAARSRATLVIADND